MYINFWYPVCLTCDLGADAPLRARILSLPFVAFRDSDGQPHVLAETCVHRGGSLGAGKIIDDAVACPYHGWQFDGTGRCVHIPTSGNTAKLPARAKVDSYPTIERYGIVFAFLGDLPESDRPPQPEIPEWNTEGWRASGLTTLDLSAYYERSMENGLDPVHNEFVHDLQGNIRFRADRMKVTDHRWGTEVYIRMDPPKPGTTQLESLRNDDDPEHFGATSIHHGPNTLVTTINLSKDNSFIQYFFEQPIDEKNTRIFFINLRNCMLEETNDDRLQQINLAIADEDITIVTELYPARTPDEPGKELLVIGDECITGYRQHLAHWQELGWRVDRKALAAADKDVAYAIPCPARKTEKNWVLDPIPLMSTNSN